MFRRGFSVSDAALHESEALEVTHPNWCKMNSHRNELHPLERETRLHKDRHPTQEVICGLAFNETRAIEGAGMFPVLNIKIRTLKTEF